MTGGEYDLIAFDPRGTGETIPFSCYPKTVDGQLQLLTASYKIPNSVTGSNTDLGTVWAGKEILANLCYQNAREYGELIGTAFVARDLMQIVDALGEDGLLRYWGESANLHSVLRVDAAAFFLRKLLGCLNALGNFHFARFRGFHFGQSPFYCAARCICIVPWVWKMAAKERYTGGFSNIKTKHPLLFVGNTYDPLTPLASARNASAAFDGSVVLQHDGYGHTSASQPSLCTAKVRKSRQPMRAWIFSTRECTAQQFRWLSRCSSLKSLKGFALLCASAVLLAWPFSMKDFTMRQLHFYSQCLKRWLLVRDLVSTATHRVIY